MCEKWNYLVLIVFQLFDFQKIEPEEIADRFAEKIRKEPTDIENSQQESYRQPDTEDKRQWKWKEETETDKPDTDTEEWTKEATEESWQEKEDEWGKGQRRQFEHTHQKETKKDDVSDQPQSAILFRLLIFHLSPTYLHTQIISYRYYCCVLGRY